MPTKKEKQPLSVTHPELAKEADGWDPEQFTKGMNKVVDWKCRIGHRFSTTIVHRTSPSKPSGCPICANRVIDSGFNDFATLHPELLAEVDGWDPTKFGAGSGKILPWKCSLGHNWTSSIIHRTRNGYGGKGTSCPFCSGARVLTGFNDLASTHPKIANEADGWNPKETSAGSSKKLSWRCSQGHSWLAIVHSRTRTRAADCPYCTNRKVLVGFNDLLTTNPEIAKEADGWDPSTVTGGMDKPRSWKCQSGHRWKTDVQVRTRGSGCPSCSTTGYDPNLKGYLYLIQHPNWNMLQVGITNDLETRMKSHKILGWQPLQFRGPMDGLLAREWETAILRMLKAKGADLSNAKIAGKFDGYSEAWSKSTFEVKSIKELMRLTEEFEEI